MKIVSSISQNKNSIEAINQCIKKLSNESIHPSILLCYFTEEHDAISIVKQLKQRFPNSKIHGCTSCQAVMTDELFAQQSVALWGFFDPHIGSYGTSIIEHKGSTNIAETTHFLLDNAIKDSGRNGELPTLVLLHATPGNEETIIAAIDDFFGTPVPLIGGSAADNNVKGDWHIFTQKGIVASGISISVFYPSCKVSYSFHSGYANSNISGIATKTDKRVIYEIDHRPVIDVYKEWTKLAMIIGDDINLLEQVTQYPLGRIAGYMHDVPYFKLTHPVRFTHDGGMACFANIKEGEELFMMYGEKEQIISRPQRVIDSVLGYHKCDLKPIGGINIFCAGSMMHIKSHMSEVCHSLNTAMHYAPYICPFTFGEQGRFTGGENAHGNLMASAVLFHH